MKVPLTNDSAVLHLRSIQVEGPWISVFGTWQAAMTRRASLQHGVTEIYILAVDLEQLTSTMGQSLTGCSQRLLRCMRERPAKSTLVRVCEGPA